MVVAIIAATGTLLTALTVLLTAVGVLVPILRKQRSTEAAVQRVQETVQETAQVAVDKVAEVQTSVAEVHTLVNSTAERLATQHTETLRYQAELVGVLHEAGIAVPVDASLIATPSEEPAD
jgi:prophage DNA circulation protein